MPTVNTSQIRQGNFITLSFSSTISERRPNQYCEFKCMASRISKCKFCCFNSSRIGQHVIVALGDEYNWLLYYVQEFIFWKLTKFFLHYDCQSHRLFWIRRDLRCISQHPPAFVNIRDITHFVFCSVVSLRRVKIGSISSVLKWQAISQTSTWHLLCRSSFSLVCFWSLTDTNV